MSGLLPPRSASRDAVREPRSGGEEFKDVLPAPPAAIREFPRERQPAMFTEVYDNS